MTTQIFQQNYDGESIVDASRDFSEAFDRDFNPVIATIPADAAGFQKGTFKVTVEWIPE